MSSLGRVSEEDVGPQSSSVVALRIGKAFTSFANLAEDVTMSSKYKSLGRGSYCIASH